MNGPSTLYASFGELNDADRITLYAPAGLDPDIACVDRVTVKRDGISPFVVTDAQVIWHRDLAYVDAKSMPGNQSCYRYMLLRECGAFDRATGDLALLDAADPALVGMTHWDRYAVDQRPGLYYATARDEAGKTALMLGPFDRHIDALVRVQRASDCLPDVFGLDCWALSFGTMRLDADPHTAPRGKLNEHVLSVAERDVLPRLGRAGTAADLRDDVAGCHPE